MYASVAHRFVCRLGVTTGEAEDVLQQIFVVVWQKLDTYQEGASERAWVLSIARRVAANHRRKVGRERPLPAIETPASPEEHVSHREAALLVRVFMNGLDEPRRVVFHLADVEGMTAPEIAQVTGANLNTVYTRLRAARRAFKAYVDAVTEGIDDG